VQGGRYVALPADTPSKGQRRVDVHALYDAQTYKPRIRGIAGRAPFLA